MLIFPQNQQFLAPLQKSIENYSYILNDVIGRGFSSTVYKGLNEKSGEVVAIKVVETKALREDVQRMVLQNEIQTLKKLNSENTLHLQDVFQTLNNTYIITDFCEQGDLTSLIQNKGPLTEKDAMTILKHIINGLLELEKHGIAHRDLKPDNILIKERVPKIADFGFAKELSAIKAANLEFNVGTPLYMSPETLTKNIYSSKTDIWSLGSVPWIVQTEQELIKQIQQPIIFPKSPKISEFSRRLINKILEINPENRFNLSQLNNSLQQVQRKQFSKNQMVQQYKAVNQLHFGRLNPKELAKNNMSDCPKGSEFNSEKNHDPQGQHFSNKEQNQQTKLGRQRDNINHTIPLQIACQKTSNQQQKRFIDFEIKSTQSNWLQRCSQILQCQINLCDYLINLFDSLKIQVSFRTNFVLEKLQFLVSKNLMIIISKLKEQMLDENGSSNPLKLQQWKEFVTLTEFYNLQEHLLEKVGVLEQNFQHLFNTLKSNYSFLNELDYDQDLDAVFDDNIQQYPSFYLMLEIFLKKTIRELNHYILVEYRSKQQNIEDHVSLLEKLLNYIQVVKIIRRNMFDPYSLAEETEGKLIFEQNKSFGINTFEQLRQRIRTEIQ